MIKRNRILNICLLALIFNLNVSCEKEKIDNVVSDIDGNVYHTIKIGQQVWMKENLKTTRYSDGTNIPNNTFYIEGSSAFAMNGNIYMWSTATRGAVSSNENPSRVQGVCPTDWHLPSDSEWDELANYLGGFEVAGGKMKEAGELNWISPNTGATNESGFTALPQGITTVYYPVSTGNAYRAYWWSSTAVSTAKANYRSVSSDSEMLFVGETWEASRASVRCVRDY